MATDSALCILNARIVDGTGAAPFTGSVLVRGGIIEQVVAGDAEPDDGTPTLDAGGLALCPGFIDTHSHSDLYILEHPDIPAKIRQGVTTEFLGQDGIAMAPLPEDFISTWRRNLAGLDGDSDDIDWNFRDTDGYLQLLESANPATNLCYLAPHGNVRMEAMGLDDRLATDAELVRMCAILAREFDAGAYGLSTGLIYPPCLYADTRELTALCAVAADYGRPLVIHQRSEADAILESMDEVLAVGRATGVHIHFSHFKICGKNNAHKLDHVLGRLDTARAEGMRITFDLYPYVAGSTMLGVILPPWAHSGGTDALMRRLADPEQRARMVTDIHEGIPGWDNFVDFAGVEGIFITSVGTGNMKSPNEHVIGLNLAQLGDAWGKAPLEAAMDLLLAERNAVGMVDFYGLEEHVETFLQRPEMNVCTDGLLGGTPHPRVFGAFPRVLDKYVRERGIMPLEDAVHRMTGRPADTFGLSDRGRIAAGLRADLVLIDPGTVRDKGTYTDPAQHPVGIGMVMVNGAIVFDGALGTGARGGWVLRAGKTE